MKWTTAHSLMIFVIFQSSVKLRSERWVGWKKKLGRSCKEKRKFEEKLIHQSPCWMDGDSRDTQTIISFVTRQQRILPTPITLFAIDKLTVLIFLKICFVFTIFLCQKLHLVKFVGMIHNWIVKKSCAKWEQIRLKIRKKVLFFV